MTTPRPLEAVPDDPIEALFTGDRAEFTAARDRLARDLKRAGHPDEAAAVKALRKPSVAAWALNQVARDGETVATFLDAAEQLRRAQEDGAEPAELRAAIEAHRAALRDVLDATASAAGTANPDVVRTEASRTLEAAALDTDVGALVRAGRVSGSIVAPSAFDALTLSPTRTPTPKPAPKPTVKRAPKPAAQRAPTSDRSRRAAERLAAARTAAAGAQVESAEAHAQVRRAEDNLEQARRAASRADAALTTALAALERATDAASLSE